MPFSSISLVTTLSLSADSLIAEPLEGIVTPICCSLANPEFLLSMGWWEMYHLMQPLFLIPRLSFDVCLLQLCLQLTIALGSGSPQRHPSVFSFRCFHSLRIAAFTIRSGSLSTSAALRNRLADFLSTLS